MNIHKYENSLAEMSAAASPRHLACALWGSMDAAPVLEKMVNGGARAAWLTRLHGPRGGRLRYYLVEPILHPWECLGGGSFLQVCAERISQPAAGLAR